VKDCCRTCGHFRSEQSDDFIRIRFHCDFHDLHHNEVCNPDLQYCGPDGYINIKSKIREEKLNIILHL
jgi:hypothetical protein